MAAVLLDKPVPNFNFTTTQKAHCQLSDLQGQNIVLYFYPKDNTPGCTTEGLDFNQKLSSFKRLNTMILGVSRNNLKSHENFINKQNFKFDLISDSDEKLCNLFTVLKEKNMYGRKVIGIERSTFLIDSKGVLRYAWRKVKVPEHVQIVLAAVKNL